MNNLIFVCVGMVAIWALVTTSNMNLTDKFICAVLTIGGSILIGFTFTPDGFYLIPCMVTGQLLGWWVNKSISTRRRKVMMQVLKENKTSL